MHVPLSVRLKVKYGLRHDPSERDIFAWRRSVVTYLVEGLDLEESGRRAAFDIFVEIDTAIYLSEADTIEVLLREAAAMTDLNVALRIKYRTETVPTDQQVERWASRARELIRDGVPAEEAGALAANEILDVNPNLILKAEADTIEALLERIRER